MVSPDGHWAAAINATNPMVRFANLDSARVERKMELPASESVQVLAWNSDGDLLQVCSEMQIFIGRFDRHQIPVKRLVKEDHGIFGISFSPDSAWVLSTGYNGRSRLWDWSSETPLAEYAGAGTAIQWSPDGRWIAWKDEFQWELIRFDPPTGWSVIPEVPPTLLPKPAQAQRWFASIRRETDGPAVPTMAFDCTPNRVAKKRRIGLATTA